jgi:hypothetical protein
MRRAFEFNNKDNQWVGSNNDENVSALGGNDKIDGRGGRELH